MNFLFKGKEKELSEYGIGGIKEGLRFGVVFIMLLVLF